MDTEIPFPKKYLHLTSEQRRDVSKTTPALKPLGFDLDRTDFIGMSVKWKTPRYKVKF